MRPQPQFTRLILVPLLCALALEGCATVSHGRKQVIHVATDPSGAQASLRGKRLVIETPGELQVRRRSAPVIELSREGCEPVTVTLDRKLSRAFWRNGIVIGIGGGVAATAPDDLSGIVGVAGGAITIGVGLAGMLVDLATGGAFEVRPSTLHVDLDCGQENEPPSTAGG